MSSEVQLNGLMADFARSLSVVSLDHPPQPSMDRVLSTAWDPPTGVPIPPSVDPAAGHHDPELARRRFDVDEKHRRLIGFLQARGLDGVILTRADSIAWFTAGGDLSQDLTTEGATACLFINACTRAVLADNVQSARIFEEELAGLGFQLKERAWHHDPSRIIAELAHQKRVASDAHVPDLIFEGEPLQALRRPITHLERSCLRKLGRTLSLAVEATCRNIQPDETEAEVAGQLAHRLIREGVVPVELRVSGDGRLARYRRPTFKNTAIGPRATITATGRRQGLCASISRTVCFGKVPHDFRAWHTLASMVDATCIHFSRPGEPISEVFRRARRIFEKFDHPHEWTLDYQGDLIGYAPRELPLVPDCSTRLQAGSALRWSPSVESARSEDTVIIDDQGFEVITQVQDWPLVEVSVKGCPILRPGLLER